MTWMIEGRWTGPINPAGDWTNIVHREFTRSRKFVEQVCELSSILFTDGTKLLLSVDERTQGSKRTRGSKRPPEIPGYGPLIRDCIRLGVNSVAALPKPVATERGHCETS
jgi:hypothetical protein